MPPPLFFLRFTSQGRLRYANQALCARVGRSMAQLVERGLSDLVSPEALARLTASGPGATGAGVLPLTFRAHDGSPVHVRGELHRDALADDESGRAGWFWEQPQEGAPPGDLTYILAQLPDGVLLSDLQHVIYANPAACALLDRGMDELRHKNPLDLLIPEQRSRARREFFKLSEGEVIGAQNYVVQCGDGSAVAVEITTRLLELDGATRVLNILRDMRQMHSTEAALKRAEQLHRAIFISAHDGLLAVDTEGVVRIFNPAAERIFGYPAQEVVGQPLSKLLPERYHSAHRKHTAAFLGRDVDSAPMTPGRLVPGLHHSGRELKLEISLGKVRSAEGMLMTAAIRDASERLQLQYKLQQAQKMEAVGRLAAGVAHDFNNALGVIQGYADLCRDQVEPNSPMGEDLNEIADAAQRALSLTRDLLLFSPAKKRDSALTDVHEALRALEGTLRELLPAGVELRTTLAARPSTARIDRAHLDRIIINLVVNACDAMPEGGRLNIETRGRGGQWLELVISDSGIGMDADTRLKAVEPFFTTKSGGEGSGLGLSAAVAMVEQAGGDFTLDSEEGAGTRVTICFATDSGELEPHALESIAAQPNSEASRRSVLLVEDEEILRRLFRRSLERAGYRIYGAASVPEAQAILAGTEIDVLVSDLVLHEGSGLQLADEVAERYPKVKIVLMTGYSEELIQRRSTPAAVPVLSKPLTGQDLVQAVEQALAGD
ncbi:MAG: PAS domain S-box protein [Myxococcales bacterium]|nr:PAS domain S-box protein [Myxococcales bacterium]